MRLTGLHTVLLTFSLYYTHSIVRSVYIDERWTIDPDSTLSPLNINLKELKELGLLST